METYFASAQRSSDDELAEEIAQVKNNAMVSGILHSVMGLVAVLNEHRQVLALNDKMLETLGIRDPADALGLRPGEVFKCVHACEMPDGCGTSQFCSTCGAAISIVTSLVADMPVEEYCALTVDGGAGRQDLFFRVRCVPISHDDRRFLLLFLQDMTSQQRLACMEKALFNDMSGIIRGLINASQLIPARNDNADLARTICGLSMRLADEVAVQRSLCQAESTNLCPTMVATPVLSVMKAIGDQFRDDPAAQGRKLTLSEESTDVSIKTQPSLLMRVLSNMVRNALEASDPGDEVKVWVEPDKETLAFAVWNRKYISPDTARRIFQRNFSTKFELGKGLGAFSIKVLGEQVLGGKVNFTSSRVDGTVFRFAVPIVEPKPPDDKAS